MRLGTAVAAIESEQHCVRLAGGDALAYEHLVLALGSAPRELRVPGADLEGVLTLRTRDDAGRLRDEIASAQDVVVVGGGFIGLEVAAAAASSCRVTVVEPQDRVLARAVVPLVSEVVQHAHDRVGTRLRLGTGLERFLGADGRVCAAVLSDADLAVLG